MQIPAALKFCWRAGICPGLLKRLPAILIGAYPFVLIRFHLCPFVEKLNPNYKNSIYVFRFRDTILSL